MWEANYLQKDEVGARARHLETEIECSQWCLEKTWVSMHAREKQKRMHLNKQNNTVVSMRVKIIWGSKGSWKWTSPRYLGGEAKIELTRVGTSLQEARNKPRSSKAQGELESPGLLCIFLGPGLFHSVWLCAGTSSQLAEFSETSNGQTNVTELGKFRKPAIWMTSLGLGTKTNAVDAGKKELGEYIWWEETWDPRASRMWSLVPFQIKTMETAHCNLERDLLLFQDLPRTLWE